jgi:hypothetical protein
MADRDTDDKSGKGQEKQVIGGQQSHRSEYGSQGEQTESSGGQPIGGNDSATGSGTPLTQGAEFGSETATSQARPGSGSAPPRSMGTHGTEFGQMADYDRSGQQGQSGTGQADLGSQAGSTLAGRSDQQELGETGGEIDQPASYGDGISGRQSNTEGEGFILQQGSGSDDLQQQGTTSASSAQATDGEDFAPQGRGALEGEQEDVEGSQARGPRSDVERN